MKAVQLYAYGDVDQLHYEDVPDPKPAADEVLVRVASIGINPVDYKIRKGFMKSVMPIQFPAILGRDVAGTVVEVGKDVTTFKPGDEVLGLVTHGYAELVADKASMFAKLPSGLKVADAAALPLILLTGSQLIEDGVKPKSGDTVLVTGALGSVGRTAVYVAKQHGATVIAGVRTKEKDEAESIGADQVVAIDDAAAVTGLPELDAIADCVGGELAVKLSVRLKKSGVLASVVGKPEVPEGSAFRVAPMFSHPDARRLGELAEDVAAGKLVIPIGKRMKLAEIREAQQMVEKGGAGKVVLTP